MIAIGILFISSLLGTLILFTAILCLISDNWTAFEYIWSGIDFLTFVVWFIIALIVYTIISILQHYKLEKEELETLSKYDKRRTKNPSSSKK